MNIKYIIAIALIATFITSCDKMNNRKEFQKNFNEILNWYGEKIDMPNKLILLQNNDLKEIDMNKQINNDWTILCLLNNECSNCTVSDLMFWEGFINQHPEISSTQIVLIYPGENHYFREVFIQDLPISIPVFLDESNFFIEKNAILSNPLYTTLLLDDKNIIKLMGNIKGNIELEKLYLEQLSR